MTKRKTELDYESDIAALHRQLLVSPDSDVIKKKIAYRVKMWMTFLDVRVYVANNEQRAWTSEMIGFPTESMPTKKDSGYDQVGDYVGVIKSPGGAGKYDGGKYISILIERKSVDDLYNTLIAEDNRKRFYREIDRFNADERFDKMLIMVEGAISDFLLYQPEFDGGEFDYKRRFDTKKNDIINEKKMTVLADMAVAGVPVIFCDNATIAATLYGRIIREYIRKDYARIIGLC